MLAYLMMPIDMFRNPFHKGLGVHDGKLKKLPSTPNCVSTQTDQKRKRVAPLPYVDGDRELTRTKIKGILGGMPDDIRLMADEPNYLYVVFVSHLWKFRDDVEFYFDDETQRVEYRSSSRLGVGDMGVNKERYRIISQAFRF